MSIKLMSEVFNDEDLDSNKKLIMLSIADNCNDEGFCYPSLTLICKKTSLSRPTILKHLKELNERNLLLSKRRNRKKTEKGGGRLSNIYIIYPYKYWENLDEDLKAKFSQSKEALLGSQSKEALPIKGSQSKEALPKPSPSLFNHHLYKQLGVKEKELFIEYLKLRKSMKVKNTNKIIDRLLTKLFEFGNHKEVIEKAIISNWKDFYPISKPKNNNNNLQHCDAVGVLDEDMTDPLSVPDADMSYDPVSIGM